MTLEEALRKVTYKLKEAAIDQPRLEAEILLAWASNLSRPQLLARLDEELPVSVSHKLWQAVEQRGNRYPLQYIIGRQQFMSLDFRVTSDVLIPRQDTEVVVENVLKCLKSEGNYCIADCGTGSGAIALSLAYFLPNSNFYATDINPSALAVAQQNARNLGLADRVTFGRGNFLSPFKSLKFDVIVSNPPYIPTGELGNLPKEVQAEPLIALDGGPDGLAAYREILPQAAEALVEGGLLAMEIGYNQGADVLNLAKAIGAFRDIRILPDYAGRDRCFLAYRHSKNKVKG
ncbi:MAG: release factor glutamine methyltransferase [Clostridia bacterium]|nr:release factor glutamine methyltransferase [Clostridia bacterium]